MADISIINKDNTNYNVKDAVGREALAAVENKGAKNIAEVTAVSSTAGGVDYIVNPDGTVIANRTASSTSSTWFRLNESLSLKAGTYVLSGGKNSGERVLLSPTTSLADAIADSQGRGAEFTLTEDTDNLIYAIRVAYTDSPSNVKFYPMICSKAEWDISNAFVPHGKTNADLTLLEKQDRAGLATAIDKGAKNVADMSKSSFTTNEKDGVTVTLSGNTITSSGTSGTSINQFHRILYNGDDLLIPPGTWIAALIGTGTDAFRIEVFATGYEDLVKGTYGSTVEFTIPDNATTSYLRITQKPSTNCAGTFKLLITTKSEWDISQAYVPYGKTNAELTNDTSTLFTENTRQETEIGVVANAGAKNILKVTAKSGSSYGITREVSDDGTITLTTGQAQNNPTLAGVSSEIFVPKGNWILSGCPSGGGDSTYRMDIRISGTATVLAIDTGSGGNLTLSDDTTCSVFIRVAYNYSVSNLVFKPMLRPAAITDTSYQPYARSNPALTAEMDYVVNAGAKNLLPMTHTSGSITRYGVTCTWDLNAGTMALNGTHRSGDSASIFEFYDGSAEATKMLPAGSYVLTGCPAGGSTSTYRAVLSQIAGAVDVGNGATFELSEPHYAAYRILISGNVTFNNMVFKPMIRPAAITDPTFQPYARSNPALTAEMDYVVNAGAKNLLNPDDYIKNSTGGLTITETGTGTYKITGTPSGTVDVFTTQSGTFDRMYGLEAGKTYTISGLPTGNGLLCRIDMSKNNSGSWDAQIISNLKLPQTFTVPSDATGLYIRYRVTTSATIPSIGISLEPMIRPAEITDPTFKPYAKTNRELTVLTDEDRDALVLNRHSGYLRTKNLLDLTRVKALNPTAIWNDNVMSLNGVDWTFNNDGSITVDGTANSYGSYPILMNWKTLQTRSYMMSGGNPTVKFTAYTIGSDKGNGFQLDIDNATAQPIVFIGNVANGTVVNNITISPMLCTLDDYQVSSIFEPYSPSNFELMLMILALQSGEASTQSVQQTLMSSSKPMISTEETSEKEAEPEQEER